MMKDDVRIAYLPLGSVQYPLCFSISAKQRIEERFGSLSAMFSSLTSSNEGVVDTLIAAIEILIAAGSDRVRILAKISGEPVETLPELSSDELRELLTFGELSAAISVVMHTVGIGSQVTVEAEPSKNVETTP